PRTEKVGSLWRGPGQLHVERGRDHPAGTVAEQPALVRQGSHAGLCRVATGARRCRRRPLMPLFGKQDVQAVVARAPLMNGFGTEAGGRKNPEILPLPFEVIEGPAEWLIPPALHPSIPPYAALSVARFPTSPVGPFALAQVRLVVRAGIR